MKSRNLLRKEAKRIYKEQTKGVPKYKRIPFSEFFKQFKKSKSNSAINEQIKEVEEDFDFENFVNINNIDEDIEKE